MRPFAIIAVLAVAASGANAFAQKLALTGVMVSPCENVAENRCNIGSVRVLPSALKAFHEYKKEPAPWTTPYIPLTASELAAMSDLQDALMTPPDAPAAGKFKELKFEIYSSEKPSQSFDETRELLASHTCRPATAESLTFESDSIERYGLMTMACERDGKPIRKMVTVAMRDSRIVLAHFDYALPVYADDPNAPKKPATTP